MLVQNAVRELEEARSGWETVMENVCTQYQRLEEERMEYQRDVMWVAINMGSAVAVQKDQVRRAARHARRPCVLVRQAPATLSLTGGRLALAGGRLALAGGAIARAHVCVCACVCARAADGQRFKC